MISFNPFDWIVDENKRKSWIALFTWQGSTLLAFLLTVVALEAYHLKWLPPKIVSRDAQLWWIIAILGVRALCVLVATFRSRLQPSPPTAQSLNDQAAILKQQFDKDVKEYQNKLADLQARMKQFLEEEQKPRLIVVSWPGYTEKKIVDVLKDFKIAPITYVRGIDRATRFTIDGELPDIIVVDIELYKLASESEVLLNLDREYELNHSRYAINAAVMGLDDVEPEHFLPLRLGLNALAFSKPLWGKGAPTGYEALFERASCPPTFGADAIGIWNWYLPTMLVLFLAIGQRPDAVANLNGDDTQTQLKTLWDTLQQNGFMSRVKAFYNHVDSLITDLEHARISLVPAGGGWTFRPYGQHGTQDLVGTVIPKQGGLIWLEGAIVLRKDGLKRRHAVRFLTRLLEEESQRALCMEGPYGGCPVTDSAIRVFAREDYLKRRSDCGNIFVPDFTHFENYMYPRKFPRQHKLWEAWWDRFTAECQRHGARVK